MVLQSALTLSRRVVCCNQKKVLGTWDLTNSGTAVVLAAKLRPNAASVSTQFKGPGQMRESKSQSHPWKQRGYFRQVSKKDSEYLTM